VSPAELAAHILVRHLVLALAEDSDLAEVADVLSVAGQLARRAVGLRGRDGHRL
jgi:hypothetical protein